MSLKIQSGPLNLERNYSTTSKKKEGERSIENRSREIKKTKKDASHSRGSFSFRLGFSQRYVQAEQTAAGWPHWLSSAASEAVDGWVPLRADSFEKLEKVGLDHFKLQKLSHFCLFNDTCAFIYIFLTITRAQ